MLADWHTCIVCLCLWLSRTAGAQGPAPVGTNTTGPLSVFKSRPDLSPPIMNITLLNESYVTPGYLFIAPYQTFQESIAIYDNSGNLVYSGYGSTGGGPSHNFHVCSINGNDNLCYITGGQNVGYVRGYGVVMDNTFTSVTSLKSQGGVANFDEHEFNVVDNGKNVLMTLYNPEHYDLTAYNITTGQGWIMNCYFQKLEIGTNRLVFEWNALDHVPLRESVVKPHTTESSGTGLEAALPWDWFHINSVDQNAAGDYLVSSRHTSTIFKVSGQDGSIIWRLGGSMSDFSFPAGLNFSFQHDARWRSENATTTVLSLFDNASNGYNQTSRYSSGMILKLDHTSNSVSLLSRFIAPQNFISSSQGNLQLIPETASWETANAFMGWGENAYIAEYTNDGTMVQQGHFATTGTMNYRAFKANFTTNPTDTPALYTYAHNDSAPTVYYMSWNGATQVAQWRMYGSSEQSGPWSVVDTVAKTGFETTYTASQYYAWGVVESLDTQGNPLKNSTRPIKTFVPGTQLAALCDGAQCPVATTTSARSGGRATSTTTGASSATSSKSAALDRSKKNKGEMGLAALVGAGMMQFI